VANNWGFSREAGLLVEARDSVPVGQVFVEVIYLLSEPFINLSVALATFKKRILTYSENLLFFLRWVKAIFRCGNRIS
jgi:uncharacterized membrane protein